MHWCGSIRNWSCKCSFLCLAWRMSSPSYRMHFPTFPCVCRLWCCLFTRTFKTFCIVLLALTKGVLKCMALAWGIIRKMCRTRILTCNVPSTRPTTHWIWWRQGLTCSKWWSTSRDWYMRHARQWVFWLSFCYTHLLTSIFTRPCTVPSISAHLLCLACQWWLTSVASMQRKTKVFLIQK